MKNGEFSQLTNVGGTLYFVVAASHRWELWRSDGTRAGTLGRVIWSGATGHADRT